MSADNSSSIQIHEGSANPIVDIFYKTYPGDEEWITYSIKSVYKFARGFRQIVVVSNSGHHYHPPSGNLPVKYVELDLPPDDARYPNGVGYWWQMGIKLCWDRFTDADAVVVVDSDQIFYDHFSPASWRKDGKIIWMRRPWSEAGNGVIWKPGADFLLGKDTPYDYMVGPGFYITRTALQSFTNFMQSRFAQTPDQYYIDVKNPRTSEFVPIGAYIDHIQDPEYGFYHPRDVNYRPWPLKQYWSWGKITEEIRTEIEEFLK
ncbi:hypothetical protein O3V59_21165 [Brevibacillus thermoruber]|uniref:Glycosyltransferase n=1 Tax=Brevibacillus thermoruber TaxID=33942 RepID=A0A9X3Z5H3_9BACL|nr:hypothetical protein [Brevibacillus thermoruber]MDA5110853.1 hypothetical protein [Brevibacillus thermoruber]